MSLRLPSSVACWLLLAAAPAAQAQVVDFDHAAVEMKQAAGILPNTVRCELLDRRTGFQPVREDSASRLSANETTGWKPVGQDRRDAQYCPLRLGKKRL